eukprot:jgi/Astpho2/1067/gw1.00017.19.1_t
MAIVVGDLGEEDELLAQAMVQGLKEAQVPWTVQLGNHDAWHSLTKKRSPCCAALQRQMQIFGSHFLGYGSTQLPEKQLSVVGGRPFSKGGASWDSVGAFYQHVFGVSSSQDSCRRMAHEIACQPASHAVVVVGHNGPTGLGSERHSPVGNDFQTVRGDHGDQDVEDALKEAAAGQGGPVALHCFGHMHNNLNFRLGAGHRNMVAIDGATGTAYVNAAQVPRL